MAKYFIIICTFILLLTAGCVVSDISRSSGFSDQTTLYSFSAASIEGNEIPLSRYKGKVVMVVNTASKCGFTKQYEGLQDLYDQYKDQGLVILGFPCNQFGSQEPGTASEIMHFCKENYGVSFQMFEKIDVNGPQSHPVYDWLKETLPDTDGKGDIKWNFTKFLIDRSGEAYKRFSPQTKPEAISGDIEELLSE